MNVNEEIRMSWAGTARFNAQQGDWALAMAAHFAKTHGVEPKKVTGSRRGVIYADCSPLREHEQAHIYFTAAGAVVVRFYGKDLL